MFKRKKPDVDPAHAHHDAPRGRPGDPVLPGSAGYRGVERLKKGAMPVSRFTFVRPDGKKDR